MKYFINFFGSVNLTFGTIFTIDTINKLIVFEKEICLLYCIAYMIVVQDLFCIKLLSAIGHDLSWVRISTSKFLSENDLIH